MKLKPGGDSGVGGVSLSIFFLSHLSPARAREQPSSGEGEKLNDRGTVMRSNEQQGTVDLWGVKSTFTGRTLQYR